MPEDACQPIGAFHTVLHVIAVLRVTGRSPGVPLKEEVFSQRWVINGERHKCACFFVRHAAPEAVGVHDEITVPVDRYFVAVDRTLAVDILDQDIGKARDRVEGARITDWEITIVLRDAG